MEGLLKIDIWPKSIFVGPTPGTIPSEQVGVSPAREETFSALGAFWVRAFQIIFKNQWKGCQKSRSGNSHPDPPDPSEVVAASAPQNLPSTCAGGQDDGCLNKLPQMTFKNTT